MQSDPLSSAAIKAKAWSLGFEICRILPARAPDSAAVFRAWLRKGMAADMDYLARSEVVRVNPLQLAPTPRSVLVLARRYPIHAPAHQTLPEKFRHDRCFGWVARYAWGPRDYHKVLRKPLIALDQFVRSQSGRENPAKGWTDSGPVLERDLAQQAGIGFIGKNTCAIHSDWGSWFFLASLWLPEALEYDDWLESEGSTSDQQGNINLPPRHWPIWHDPHPQVSRVGGCGRCTRCLTACPTEALKPYQLDARLCIAYWTIEAKQAPPEALAKKFGRWIFGCDVCQDVCPWNAPKEDPAAHERDWHDFAFPNGPLILLAEGFNVATPYWLDDAAFLEKFQGTPIMRSGREMMRRNVLRVQSMDHFD